MFLKPQELQQWPPPKKKKKVENEISNFFLNMTERENFLFICSSHNHLAFPIDLQQKSTLELPPMSSPECLLEAGKSLEGVRSLPTSFHSPHTLSPLDSSFLSKKKRIFVFPKLLLHRNAPMGVICDNVGSRVPLYLLASAISSPLEGIAHSATSEARQLALCHLLNSLGNTR